VIYISLESITGVNFKLKAKFGTSGPPKPKFMPKSKIRMMNELEAAKYKEKEPLPSDFYKASLDRVIVDERSKIEFNKEMSKHWH
jgi:hypothetical protein